jgi:hypothetical protein
MTIVSGGGEPPQAIAPHAVLLPARGEEGARSALGAAKPERIEQYLILTNKRMETERRGFVSPSSSEFFLLVLCYA